ncbi:MAG: hypothetical protein LUD68_06075 [Rikenellaceae bacterium]|nr:hypothetical protein [Rikenellaceae bacterium]
MEYGLLNVDQVKSKPGPRYPGEKIIHDAWHVVRGKVKRSAIPTPAPCNPENPTDICAPKNEL